MKPKILLIFFLTFFCTVKLYSQSRLDSIADKINPDKWSKFIERKLGKLEDKIIAKSEKTLLRLQKQEEKIYRSQLATKDSLTAKAKLAEIQSKYMDLETKLKKPASLLPDKARQYIPHLDTLKTAFKFLDQQGATKNIKDALSKIESFEGKMQQAEDIKKFIRDRHEQLKQQLEQLGLVKDLKKFNKEVYYYSEQIKEYKQILSDPKKIEKKAIELLSKTKIFQDFMKKNSMLASLFRMPGDPADPAYIASLAGLQTRGQVNNLIQQQISSGGPNAQAQFQQNIQQAQSQLNALKEKLLKASPFDGGLEGAGGGSSDGPDSYRDMPQGFKPNDQKTKSFFKRLEYGTNIQTQRAQYYFPITSDIGLSLGYKLNDKSTIGVGASYKLGLGRGWNNIQFSSQGAGLRSYVDWKLKGSFWLSGGYEMNYKTTLRNLQISSPLGGAGTAGAQLREGAAWQQSGLIGLSKVISVKTKFFKKTKVQLLWDFLSYQQIPKTQPIIFRIGYSLK